jgi:topoisomerase IA-like protein
LLKPGKLKSAKTIETVEDGKNVVYQLPKDIDIHDIKNGKTNVSTLKKKCKDKKNASVNRSLGKYKDKEVILKNGKYGLFVTYDKQNISVRLKDDTIDINDIVMDDVTDSIEYKINPNLKERNSQDALLKNKNVIRIIDSVSQLRNGKFGHYIYYKRPEMTKPLFINLTKPKPDIDFEKDDIEIIKDWMKKKITPSTI